MLVGCGRKVLVCGGFADRMGCDYAAGCWMVEMILRTCRCCWQQCCHHTVIALLHIETVIRGVFAARTCCRSAAGCRMGWTLPADDHRARRRRPERYSFCLFFCLVLLSLAVATPPEHSPEANSERRHTTPRSSRRQKPCRHVSWCSRSSD
jgi:hypothetical protein